MPEGQIVIRYSVREPAGSWIPIFMRIAARVIGPAGLLLGSSATGRLYSASRTCRGTASLPLAARAVRLGGVAAARLSGRIRLGHVLGFHS
jgi:hypothetical protein